MEPVVPTTSPTSSFEPTLSQEPTAPTVSPAPSPGKEVTPEPLSPAVSPEEAANDAFEANRVNPYENNWSSLGAALLVSGVGMLLVSFGVRKYTHQRRISSEPKSLENEAFEIEEVEITFFEGGVDEDSEELFADGHGYEFGEDIDPRASLPCAGI
jgi:hypothetical protein